MFYPLTRPLSAPEVGYDTHLCSVLGGCCTVSTVPLLHLPVYPGKCSRSIFEESTQDPTVRDGQLNSSLW